ncbi:MAG: hypothetical protein ABJI96_15895 [Paracoccaceae bacterium]
MMTRYLAISAICILATGAGAQELSDWGESGRWKIRIDAANGHGCLMETPLEDGSVFQFGNEPDRKGGFFAVYNPEWTDIKDGMETTVKFDFDEKRFSGEAIGDVSDDRFGARAFFDNPNVQIEFAKNTVMTILGGLGRTLEVDLSGTTKALAEIEKCQSEQSK